MPLLIAQFTGCIEDRTFVGVEDGELNQVPGADIFFSFAGDIVNFDKDDAPNNLNDSVIADVVRLGKNYTVHNDEDHGVEFDGCGFAAKIVEISKHTVDNFDQVFAGSKLAAENRDRAEELVNKLSDLLKTGYFEITGGNLVENAFQAGANLVTYVGEHTAEMITVDSSDEHTYDSADANDPNTESKPTFNLDTNHARNRAPEFDLSPDDSEILARILSTSTAYVLSGGSITELTEV